MLQELGRVKSQVGVGWPGQVLEQGPQGGEQRVQSITGEENNWDLYANLPELKSWPGPTGCPFTQKKGHREQASLTPPRSLEHMLHCPQPDHNSHMSCVPFILA